MIKTVKTSLLALAGEMINMETGKRLFVDGKLVGDGKDYLSVTIDNIEYLCKPVVACVYVPNNITDQILYNNMRQLWCGHDYLSEYCTIHSSYFTRVKVKSRQTHTALDKDNLLLTMKPHNMMNVQRQFITTLDDPRRGRFTWIVLPLSSYEPNMANLSPELYYATHMATIIYDPAT